jgi:2-amino-4-hydroxy-6-hydroxymethyldihydropteridine diphosphokinase
MRAFLGLGANLAQPERQLRAAIATLATSLDVRLVARSRLYASLPMGPQDQPDYINAVVAVETHLEPLALLDFCQSLEQSHQRERKLHWGARTLDVDILSIDDLVMNHERLTLPHVGIAQRDFVVLPWCDIAPDYVIPRLGCVKDIAVSGGFSARPLSLSLD